YKYITYCIYHLTPNSFKASIVSSLDNFLLVNLLGSSIIGFKLSLAYSISIYTPELIEPSGRLLKANKSQSLTNSPNTLLKAAKYGVPTSNRTPNRSEIDLLLGLIISNPKLSNNSISLFSCSVLY